MQDTYAMLGRALGLALSVVIASAACATVTLTGCGGPDTDDLNGARPGEDPHGDDGDGDEGPAPNDDPTLGAIVEEDGGESAPAPSPTDAGSDASTEPPPPQARIASPVPGKVVTYAYGIKNPRYAAGYHTGEDYAAAVGLPVVAVRSGTVRWSNDNGGAYGKWMGLDADNGRTYVYCHLSSRGLSAGTKVVAGQVLGKVGATGNVTGPHLHFEDHPLGPFVYAKVRKPTW